MPTVTGENRQEFIDKELAKKEGKNYRGDDEVLGKMPKSHQKGKEMDIGGGRYLHRHGYDANGNQSVWIAQGSGRARKIQMHNTPTIQKTMPELTQAGADEIHDYADKYFK